MADESAVLKPAETVAVESQRAKSTIEYPYLDLDNAIDIVKAIHKVEGDRCEWKQLATALGVAADGGGYRMRLLTAKTFGLLTYEKGQIMLTDCGIKATHPNFEKRARYEAFMNVPLFKSLFERFNGQQLPPVAAIERAIENLGAAPKQKEKVRQVFQRSAKQANLFELSSDRLSTPPGLNTQKKEVEAGQNDDQQKDDLAQKNQQGSGGGNGGQYHPFIQGLIDKLPTPETNWTLKDRAKWLNTAANIFDLMYSGPDDGEITVTFTANQGGTS